MPQVLKIMALDATKESGWLDGLGSNGWGGGWVGMVRLRVGGWVLVGLGLG